MTEQLFTLAEASAVTGIKQPTLRKWISRSEILSIKFGPQKQNFLTASELSLTLWSKADPRVADAFDQKYGVQYPEDGEQTV
jgi:hypothetical protein